MITRPLIIWSIIVAFVDILGTVPLRASVNMISVEHRVWGDAGASPTYYSYDEAGAIPQSRNVNGFSTGYNGRITYYYASSSASDWSVYAYRIGDADYGNAYAQNTYVFKPYTRELTILLGGVIGEWWFENDAQMMLTDLSANSLVSIYQSPSYFRQSPFPPGSNQMQSYPIDWHSNVEVNPEHEYELIIFVGAHRGEGGDGSASLHLTIVPEPGSAMLSSLCLLMLLRRRR